jgi:hypothetical protein
VGFIRSPQSFNNPVALAIPKTAAPYPSQRLPDRLANN